MEMNNVHIGDIFRTGKNLTAEVVDFYSTTSLTTGEIIGYKCIAKVVNGLSSNLFETPFATVVRNRIVKAS